VLLNIGFLAGPPVCVAGGDLLHGGSNRGGDVGGAGRRVGLVGDDPQHRALPTLQPDLRLVVNPGAGIPGPFGRTPLADAVVIGVRVTSKL